MLVSLRIKVNSSGSCGGLLEGGSLSRSLDRLLRISFRGMLAFNRKQHGIKAQGGKSTKRFHPMRARLFKSIILSQAGRLMTYPESDRLTLFNWDCWWLGQEAWLKRLSNGKGAVVAGSICNQPSRSLTVAA